MVDLKRKVINVPAQITKTKKKETFPIPDEVVKLIKNLPKGQKKLVSFDTNQPYAKEFKKIFIKAIGCTEEDFHGKATHQTRHLMVTTLGLEGYKDDALDAMLSHIAGKRNTARTYNLSDIKAYEEVEKLFKKYWSILGK